jgi:transcriptional regulator with XRE-family HTH domain
MNASMLAKKTEITRQAVSKWLKGRSNVESNSLMKAAIALQVDPAILLKDLFPGITPNQWEEWQTTLLWDHLYDSLESFVAALCREELPALARYVQTFGILNAEKIFGKKIYVQFDRFSKWIHPTKRKELEVLCKELQMLGLI